MKPSIALFIATSATASLLLASCGPSTPKEDAKAKPKPVYEVGDKAEAAAARSAQNERTVVKTPAPAKKPAPSQSQGLSSTVDLDGGSFRSTSLTEASSSSSSSAPAKKPAATTASKQPETKPATEQKPAPISTGALDSVINYGTGMTPLTIKKRTEQKIQNIQDSHNSQLEKALQE